MGILKEVLSLYKNISAGELFYLRTRSLISPVSLMEEMLPEAGRIYDIGCGGGLLSNAVALRSAGRDVSGIDMSPEKIAIANKSVGGRRNIRFEISDALEFNPDRPEAVIMSDFLHHIPFAGQELLVAKIGRSLKAGGILLVQDIDKRPFYKYIFAVSVDKLFNKMAPVYYRDSAGWKQFLEDAGFEVDVVKADKGLPIAAVIFKCRVKRVPA